MIPTTLMQMGMVSRANGVRTSGDTLRKTDQNVLQFRGVATPHVVAILTATLGREVEPTRSQQAVEKTTVVASYSEQIQLFAR